MCAQTKICKIRSFFAGFLSQNSESNRIRASHSKSENHAEMQNMSEKMLNEMIFLFELNVKN